MTMFLLLSTSLFSLFWSKYFGHDLRWIHALSFMNFPHSSLNYFDLNNEIVKYLVD